MNGLFFADDCQRHVCLRQQIIKRPLFIATSVEIFSCVYVCVCVWMCWHPIWQWLLSTSGRPVPFSQLESPPPHKGPEEGWNRSRWFGGAQKYQCQGLSHHQLQLCGMVSMLKTRGLCKDGGCEQFLGILMVSAFGWMLRRRSRKGDLWGIVGSTGFCVKSFLPKSRGV